MTNLAAIKTRIQFSLIILSPFFGIIILVALFFGCERKPGVVKEQQPTVTLENLQTAYTKESGFNKMYTAFSNQAKKEKNSTLASLYGAIAKSEEIHANNHAALLRSKNIDVKSPPFDSVKVGNVLQTVKMSLSSEDIEIGSMYPNLIKTAELEKFKDAQKQFEICRDADARQEELLKQVSDRGGNLAKTIFYVCPDCGYILDSDKTEQCPICSTAKEKFIRI